MLFVSDVERSVEFYQEVLGFAPLSEMAALRGAAFLQAPGSNNDHDLGLFEVAGADRSEAGRRTVGLYHLAWEVDTLAELDRIAGKLSERGALIGASDHATTKALYGRDPDGLEFEVCWLVPADLITDDMLDAKRRILPLDLAKEQERYGADTLGGIGVSIAGLVG